MGKYRVIFYYLWFLGLDFIVVYDIYYSVADMFGVQFDDGFQLIMLSPFFVVFFSLILIQIVEIKLLLIFDNFMEKG